jgi:hypothetical protein
MRYQISISGSGGKYGIGTISKEQFNFWNKPENNAYLANEARLQLENRIDIKLTIPSEAKFEDHYSSFNDVGETFGPEKEFAILTVTNDLGKEVFHGEYEDFKDRYESECEHLEINVSEEDGEHFLFWINSQKGNFYTATIETDRFEPEFLSFQETDIYGEAVLITAIHYENKPLELELGDLNSFSEEFILLSDD